MPKPKGSGGPPMTRDLTAMVLDYLTQQSLFDSQIQHMRDSMEEIRSAQDSLRAQNADIQSRNAEMQTRLFEELHQLRLASLRPETDPNSPNNLRFGSLPISEAEDKKVSIAAMHLTDEVADVWHLFRNWLGFTELLMREFGSHSRADYQSALIRLNQTGSVSEYKSQFNKNARRAPGFSDDILLACFLGGLKEDIKVDVRAMRPTSLYQAYELAMIFEERHADHRNARSNVQRSHFPTYSLQQRNPVASGRNLQTSSLRPTVAQSAIHNTQASTTSDRKWTQNDYYEKRARGLCFFCDEPYKGGHVCKRTPGQGQGRALLIEGILEDEVATPPSDLVEGDSDDGETKGEETATLHVINCMENPMTMQIKGIFRKKEVHVLIDRGATHSFIHPSLLQHSDIKVDYGRSLQVVVACGLKVKSAGKLQIQLQLQDTPVDTEAFILPVNGCEILLGATWLRTLGDLIWNYEKMTMRSSLFGKSHFLQGILASETSIVSFVAMTKLLKQEKEALCIELLAISAANDQPLKDVHPNIISLIDNFTTLFENPTGLPPYRLHDHKIELVPGAAPVSVRPYRFPQFQKK
ncbi:uncharacterized protein LOC121052317 [Rosa chinensis]|uniref:uncharacterized protein LOC121052317 n=1 Tax=Rosa chinensis TaxID=74649 RepID=UPI001AD8E13A|nr:uncharacterized protein LOC121052317 [Rosa chinensis]